MSDFIGIDPSSLASIDALKKKLVAMGRADIVNKATDEVGKYLVNVFKLYPTYKSVKRATAYPETRAGFFSDKQRRYFFWALSKNKIQVPYRRTQNYAKRWKVIDKGVNQIIVNESEYAAYLQGDNTQARLSGLIGWKKLSAITEERSDRIGEIVLGVVRREIKKAF
jgi:hypothetical protein